MSQQHSQAPLSPNLPLPNTRSLTSEERIALLEQKLEVYVFKNKLLALEALQTSNVAQVYQGVVRTIPTSKNLAILGDLLLDLHLACEWQQTGTSRDTWNKTRSRIAENKNLAEVGWNHRLDECVIQMPNTVQRIGRVWMATTVEAILGAVYKDAEEQRERSGMDAVAKVIEKLGLCFNA